MILHSSSASFGLSQASHFCPCKSTGTFAQNRHLFPLSFCSRSGRRELIRYWFFWHENVGRRYRFQPCMAFDYSPKRHCYGEFARMVRRSAKNVRVKQFDSELSNDDEVSQERSIQRGSNFTNFRGPPTRDKLRTQLGVINPIPFPRINRNISGLFVFFFVGVFVDKLFTARKREKFGTGTLHGAWPQVPASFSLLLEKDLQRKESVEWVNMVLEKLWKVYRAEIENWIIGLLQPVIDNLKKPDYVHRVQIKQFSLGDEPLSVRNIERRTTRLVNDLQYQIGVRYTGGARMLLTLSLNVGIIPIVVPVGVRDLDIDGELWVNLRLIPIEPWVGAVSWAFVSLPKIKVELSPFGLFNLMAVPVLSEFLTKLLTEDLPLLFVRPKKVILDFLKGRPVGPVANIFKSEENHKIEEGNKDFVGELSVTLVDASKLTYIFYGKTDPYVVFKLGDQTVCSKKNSQTTIIGPPGEPIWNQDFRILVANPQNQKLSIQVKDSLGFADLTIGTGEVDLGSLQDTVPTDKIVVLQGGWGWYRSRSCGEILLRLTYKAYVEDEDDWKEEESLGTHASKDELSDFDESKTTYKQAQQNSSNKTDRESFLDVLAALIVSEKFQGIIASETSNSEVSDDVASSVPPISRRPGSNDDSKGSALFWLAVGTIILVLIVLNVGGSSFFNP